LRIGWARNRIVPPLARMAASTLSTMKGMSAEKISTTSGSPS
jgi:hypothetical protein